MDLTRGCLIRDTLEVKLRPKAFDVLKYLLENSGRLVSKDELIDFVWQGMAVTDDSLVQCLKDIRNALDDKDQTYIKTVSRRGYIFEKDVRENGAAVYVEETSGVHLVIEETEETNGLGDEASGRRTLIGAVRRNRLTTALALASIVLVAFGIAYGLFVFFRRPAGPPFTSVSISRLTTDGEAQTVAISPDGNYVVYVITDGGEESIWIRQVADVNPKQIMPPDRSGYGGLVFSPDNNFVYYRQSSVLYKAPVLGGSPRKVLEDVHSTVTFSPDGRLLAFLRGGQGSGEQRLILANADGSGDEQTLAARQSPSFFALPMFGTGPAWSPDGKLIVCPAVDNGGFGEAYPLEVRVADGAQRPMTTKRWNAVVQVAWLADGSGLLMNAKDNGIDATRQIWHVAYPKGEPQRIYNDDKEYDRMSFAANPGLLVSIQREVDSSIWAIDVKDGPNSAIQVTRGSGRQDGYWGMDTTPDGKIVFDSRTGGPRDLWVMNSDGSDQKQITFDQVFEAFAKVSVDGQKILFHLGGKGLWMMDSDGGNRRQLTDGGMFPTYSADGSWVYYTLPREKWSLWKVPSAGGDPIRFLDKPAVHPSVSPDGKLLAYTDVTPGTEPTIRIIPIDGGEPLYVFRIPGQNAAKWTPDGKAITYRTEKDGITQIVSQPLDDGPTQILYTAKSTAESLRGFAWSRDGKRLYFTAGPVNKNVVLFTLEK